METGHFGANSRAMPGTFRGLADWQERDLVSRWARASSEGPPRLERVVGTEDAKHWGDISAHAP